MAKKTSGKSPSAQEIMDEAREHQERSAMPPDVAGVDDDVAEQIADDEDGWIEDDEEGWETVNTGEPLLFVVPPTVDGGGRPIPGSRDTVQGYYHRIAHRQFENKDTGKMDDVFAFELELTRPALVKNKKVNDGVPFMAPAGKKVRIAVLKGLEEHAYDVLEDNLQELRIRYVRKEPVQADPRKKFWILETKRRDSGKPHVGPVYFTTRRVDLLKLAQGQIKKGESYTDAELIEAPAAKAALPAGETAGSSAPTPSDAPKALPAQASPEGVDAGAAA